MKRISHKLLFATTNQNKIREAQEILDIDIASLDLEIDEIQTLDPLECVERKAVSAYQQTKRPILVEDTCLFFDAWNGLPGVFINYFMKTLNNEGLTRLMRQENNRRAVAQTSLCYFDGSQTITAVGKMEGAIAGKPRRENGFGWDSIFIPAGHQQTFAEVAPAAKNNISMRKLALKELQEKLSARRQL